MSYFIESFKITKLWGYRDIDLPFNSDVNILIGPNGSGKTTILNLLHSILSVNLRSLSNINFDQAEIELREFEDKSVRTIKVEAADRLLKLCVGEEEHQIDIDGMEALFGRRFTEHSWFPERGNILRRILPEDFYDVFTALVPIVWLPVSRRLPVTEGEEERYTRVDPIESVDLRLRELLEDLSRYHARLNAQLSERYREFEHQVLSEILYNEKDDQHSLTSSPLLTEAEKDQLMRAFEVAGFLDKQMRSRIARHFDAANEVLKRTNKDPVVLDLPDIFVLPLIYRTRAMVGYAEKLEEDREEIFKPLRDYEENVNSFLNGKSVKVDESGELKIESSAPSALNPYHLSSGEKQILILLTQALLKVDEPVVYIADEPELSLHVLWQEKLLDSLVTLGGEIQVIVATHSPDIVGKFTDNVIDLGRKN